MDHKEFSRKGGKAKSEKKTAAARKNARKPRGKWATAVYYRYTVAVNDAVRTGLLLFAGKTPRSNIAEWVERGVGEDKRNKDYPVGELVEYMVFSRII